MLKSGFFFLMQYGHYQSLLTSFPIHRRRLLSSRLGGGNGIKRNEKNNFRIFFPFFVWEFWRNGKFIPLFESLSSRLGGGNGNE